MKHLIVPVLTAAALVALPAGAEAAKAPKAKQVRACVDPKDPAPPAKAKKKDERKSLCGEVGRRAEQGAIDLPKAFRIVAINVDGTTSAVEDDPDFAFTMTGGTTIRSQGGRDSGLFETLEKGIVGATVAPVTTRITSDAQWSDEQAGVYDCDLQWPEASLPRSVTATGVPSRRFSRAIALNWNFVPSGWSECTQGDKRIPLPTTSNAPSDLTTTTYPASAFERVQPRKLVDLLIDIHRTWKDGEFTLTQTWKGTVTLRKLEALA